MTLPKGAGPLHPFYLDKGKIRIARTVPIRVYAFDRRGRRIELPLPIMEAVALAQEGAAVRTYTELLAIPLSNYDRVRTALQNAYGDLSIAQEEALVFLALPH